MIYLLEQDGSLKQSEAGRSLLLYGIQKEYGMGHLPEIAHSPDGKPYFPACSQIRFNISHARQGILCGIDQEELGVDIEKIISWKEGLAKRICHEAEWRMLEEEALQWKRERLLTRIWTAKESYLKCTGMGIRMDLRKIDLSACKQRTFALEEYFFSSQDGADYELCVCRKGQREALPVIKVKQKDVK